MYCFVFIARCVVMCFGFVVFSLFFLRPVARFVLFFVVGVWCCGACVCLCGCARLSVVLRCVALFGCDLI